MKRNAKQLRFLFLKKGLISVNAFVEVNIDKNSPKIDNK